ncbi:guanylate-binding protein [Heterostelium album PN500]|uniref:Guanylate-binding protein n=1 Tax=Heterostelium pallidum (strain ATCC 26659 / Pp 5 / PN500) TaxID=670386 RepID=D3B0L8_HETP5|nr:guanylate-binding protein [Heterostelium album PN500]EFA84842.1 guanylate-binding protein [Heterostelium album PN500]|eukprot:XP_020436953.1 guanylate-binding protein [Heterostelium album PN500]
MFREKMDTLKSQEPPLSDRQYQKLESDSISFVNNLYRQLLFGLEEAYKPGLIQLDKTLKELKDYYKKENNYKIKGYLTSEHSSATLTFQDKLESISIPMSNKKLLESIQSLRDFILSEFKSITNQYHNSEIYATFLNNLNNDIDRLSSQLILKNKNEMEMLLSKSIAAAIDKYKDLMNDGIKYPLRYKDLEAIHKQNKNSVNQWFITTVQIAEDEVYFSAFMVNLDKLLGEQYDVIKAYNEDKILDRCKVQSNNFKYQFKRGLGQLVLPVEEEYLEARADELRLSVLTSFKENLEVFNNTASFRQELSNFIIFEQDEKNS